MRRCACACWPFPRPAWARGRSTAGRYRRRSNCSPSNCPVVTLVCSNPRASRCASSSRALVDALAETLREKPFVVFGHSLGAWMAYEVCVELRKRGGPRPVGLVVSGARAPQLADPENDADRVQPRMADLPSRAFWAHFERSYGAIRTWRRCCEGARRAATLLGFSIVRNVNRGSPSCRTPSSRARPSATTACWTRSWRRGGSAAAASLIARGGASTRRDRRGRRRTVGLSTIRCVPRVVWPLGVVFTSRDRRKICATMHKRQRSRGAHLASRSVTMSATGPGPREERRVVVVERFSQVHQSEARAPGQRRVRKIAPAKLGRDTRRFAPMAVLPVVSRARAWTSAGARLGRRRQARQRPRGDRNHLFARRLSVRGGALFGLPLVFRERPRVGVVRLAPDPPRFVRRRLAFRGRVGRAPRRGRLQERR